MDYLGFYVSLPVRDREQQDKSNYLTHCGLVTPYGVKRLVRIGSDNAPVQTMRLLGAKPLPEAMLNYWQEGS